MGWAWADASFRKANALKLTFCTRHVWNNRIRRHLRVLTLSSPNASEVVEKRNRLLSDILVLLEQNWKLLFSLTYRAF